MDCNKSTAKEGWFIFQFSQTVSIPWYNGGGTSVILDDEEDIILWW